MKDKNKVIFERFFPGSKLREYLRKKECKHSNVKFIPKRFEKGEYTFEDNPICFDCGEKLDKFFLHRKAALSCEVFR